MILMGKCHYLDNQCIHSGIVTELLLRFQLCNIRHEDEELLLNKFVKGYNPP